MKETRHDLKSNKEIKRNSDNTNPLHTIAYEVNFFLFSYFYFSSSVSQVINNLFLSHKTVKYLETTTAAKQDENSVTLFLKEIARFNLTKTEKVILLNLRPTNELELNLVLKILLQNP